MAETESRASRRWRAVALAAFAVTAFLPVHSCGPSPLSRPSPPQPTSSTPPVARRSPTVAPARERARAATATMVVETSETDVQVPVRELAQRLPSGWKDGGFLGAIWRARAWYPYLLLPFWVVALFLTSRGGDRARRAAGVSMLVLAIGVVVLEWHYIRGEYSGLLPSRWRQLELAVAWTIVASILFLRRPGRALLDAEAAVSGQALLAALHGLTFPIADVRDWASGGAPAGRIASAILANYPWPFGLAVAATFCAAIPGYLRLPAPAFAGPFPAPAPLDSPSLEGAPAPPEGG